MLNLKIEDRNKYIENFILYLFVVSILLSGPFVSGLRAEDLDQELRNLDPEPLQIVTTTSDLAYLAKRMGGKRVKVRALLPGTANPHYQDARPDYTLALYRADVFIINGMDLEVGWVPPVLKSARNPDILPGKAGFCDASQSILALEIPAAGTNRSQGDVHAAGNPHYLMDPVNAAIAARNIGRTLLGVDPEHASIYKKNYINFAKEMNALIDEGQRLLAPYRDLKVAVYHKEFSYLARRFGFDIHSSLEEVSGVPPSAAYLKRVTRKLLRDKVRIILLAPYNERRYANSVARRINARVLIMPASVGSAPGIDSYAAAIRAMLEALHQAARQNKQS